MAIELRRQVAEEPDYRLRLIYQLPQVELLDQHSVKGSERARAEVVVPNLDKVSAQRGEKARQRPPGFSLLERRCIREAKEIGERRQKEEELLLSKSIRVPRKAR